MRRLSWITWWIPCNHKDPYKGRREGGKERKKERRERERKKEGRGEEERRRKKEEGREKEERVGLDLHLGVEELKQGEIPTAKQEFGTKRRHLRLLESEAADL